MKKLSVLVAAAAAALIGTTIVAPAQAGVFAGTCDITLGSSYTTNNGVGVLVEIPATAVSCPGFSFDPSTDALNAAFASSGVGGSASLSVVSKSVYDSTTNEIVVTHFLELNAYPSTGAFTKVLPTTYGTYNTTYYLQHGADQYMLNLTAPFNVVLGYDTSPCILTMPKLKYFVGQDDYFVIPDSAMSCKGFTWSSDTFVFSGTFKGDNGALISIGTYTREIYDEKTQTATFVNELEASLPFKATGGYLGLRARDCRCLAPTGDVSFGTFSSRKTSYVTAPRQDSSPATQYPVNLAKPFKVLAATTIVATPSRYEKANGKKMLSVHIQADRNQSFQSGDVPSYRRQTVIPKRNADHPTILANGKLITTVTLDKFGEATVSIPDKGGHQKYVVQMPKTATNWAGKAVFKA